MSYKPILYDLAEWKGGKRIVFKKFPSLIMVINVIRLEIPGVRFEDIRVGVNEKHVVVEYGEPERLSE